VNVGAHEAKLKSVEEKRKNALEVAQEADATRETDAKK